MLAASPAKDRLLNFAGNNSHRNAEAGCDRLQISGSSTPCHPKRKSCPTLICWRATVVPKSFPQTLADLKQPVRGQKAVGLAVVLPK